MDHSTLPPSLPLSARLTELTRLFLKLGTIGFGGPQAHIAMQNDEAVVRRQWMTQEQFTEGLAICEMLPGPASTQMGIYIGYVRAGQLGALAAGLAFIAPAFLIVLLLSWAYFRYQSVPQLDGIFLGISPVVIAIILAFCWKLGKRAISEWTRALIAVAVFVLTLGTPVPILVLFIGAALVGVGLYGPRGPKALPLSSGSSGSTQGSAGSSGAQSQGMILPLWLGMGEGMAIYRSLMAASPEVLALSGFWGVERIGMFFWPLVVFFLKVGSAVFGGGLVIIPFISGEVVDQFNWLSRSEFLDGVAIGQLSPGPVVLTAAFIGYKVAGVLGSLVATVAIFAPSFAFIMVASPILLRIRRNPWIRAGVQGITPAALGAIAAAAVPLAQNAILQETVLRTGLAVGITVVALGAILRLKRPTWQLVPAGAVLGLIIGVLPV